MLEKKAGISDQKLVEAHGSFKSATCNCCSYQLDTSEASSIFWKLIEEDKVPGCPKCNSGLMKPDVVLFGESLPARFWDSQNDDLLKCDLVIVMGTSLMVQPFAGLPNRVRSTVPRLLFNDKAVGVFTKGVQQEIKDIELVTLPSTQNSSRDIAILGDIDTSVQKFLTLLNWTISDS